MYLGGTESASIEILPFTPHFIKFSKTFFEVKLVSQCSHSLRGTFTISKVGSERGISIDADYGPSRYVL